MFKIHFSLGAYKNLKDLRKSGIDYEKIKAAIREMNINPLDGDVKRLKNFRFASYHKRVGDYRIIFDIKVNSKIVYIYRIQHRKDIYK